MLIEKNVLTLPKLEMILLAFGRIKMTTPLSDPFRSRIVVCFTFLLLVPFQKWLFLFDISLSLCVKHFVFIRTSKGYSYDIFKSSSRKKSDSYDSGYRYASLE